MIRVPTIFPFFQRYLDIIVSSLLFELVAFSQFPNYSTITVPYNVNWYLKIYKWSYSIQDSFIESNY